MLSVDYSVLCDVFQELVSKDRSNKKRTCVILGLIAMGAIIVLVAAIVITSSAGGGGAGHGAPGAGKHTGGGDDAPTSLTLEDFLEGHLVPRSFNGTWVSGITTYSTSLSLSLNFTTLLYPLRPTNVDTHLK